ncbi:MAG TPA: hypothetical protein VMH33_06975 [Solirubrobacterales bacterium]|nr:hypothetical protein [Solirubrobacterales bacterium]
MPVLVAAVLGLVALLAPASSMAAGKCPAGEKEISKSPYCEKETTTPPPPPPTTPPPLTTVATANEIVTGAVKVTFNVPGAGSLALKGNAIKIKKIVINASGSITVILRPTGKVLQHLENRGWTRRKQIFATFTAADGSTQTVKVVIRFRKP